MEEVVPFLSCMVIEGAKVECAGTSEEEVVRPKVAMGESTEFDSGLETAEES